MSLSEPGRTFLGRRRLQIEEVVSRNKERSMNPRTDQSHMREIVLTLIQFNLKSQYFKRKLLNLSLNYHNLSLNYHILNINY